MTILTGAQLTLTINSIDRSAITKSVIITPNETRTTNHYIGGTQTNYRNSLDFTLDCVFSSDVDKAVAGLVEAIWNAASTAPNTSIPFVLTNNAVTFTGALFPVTPTIGGEATAEQEWTVSFPTTGAVTAVWS